MRWLLGGLLILAAACGGGSKLDEGTVIDKRIDPGYDYWTTMCVAYNKYGCSARMPLLQHVPSEYEVLVEGLHEGETITEWHGVDSERWNEYQDGDRWAK